MNQQQPQQEHHTIYHLVQKPMWESARAAGTTYLPPTFVDDGFIHATREAGMLVGVANNFYTDVPDEFLCLAIDTGMLTSEVKYEAAAPVGDKPAHEAQVLFPHIYGPIDLDAVSLELAVERTPDGKFVKIEGV